MIVSAEIFLHIACKLIVRHKLYVPLTYTLPIFLYGKVGAKLLYIWPPLFREGGQWPPGGLDLPVTAPGPVFPMDSTKRIGYSRSQFKVHTDERTQVHSAQPSLAVAHPSIIN
jgi:hypothetical protein